MWLITAIALKLPSIPVMPMNRRNSQRKHHPIPACIYFILITCKILVSILSFCILILCVCACARTPDASPLRRQRHQIPLKESQVAVTPMTWVLGTKLLSLHPNFFILKTCHRWLFLNGVIYCPLEFFYLSFPIRGSTGMDHHTPAPPCRVFLCSSGCPRTRFVEIHHGD